MRNFLLSVLLITSLPAAMCAPINVTPVLNSGLTNYQANQLILQVSGFQAASEHRQCCSTPSFSRWLLPATHKSLRRFRRIFLREA
jgi:hypothetical protein